MYDMTLYAMISPQKLLEHFICLRYCILYKALVGMHDVANARTIGCIVTSVDTQGDISLQLSKRNGRIAIVGAIVFRVVVTTVLVALVVQELHTHFHVRGIFIDAVLFGIKGSHNICMGRESSCIMAVLYIYTTDPASFRIHPKYKDLLGTNINTQ